MRIPFLDKGNPLPPLTDAECKAVLDATGNALRMAFIVGFNSGISQRELLQLRKSDVDLKAQVLNVPEKHGARRVVLPYSTTQQLGEYMKTHDSLYLFPIPDTSFIKMVSDAGKRLGIQLSWQRIRSTYIKNASEAGVPILTCARNVGTNPANIIHYFRLNADEEREVIDKISDKWSD